MATYTRNYPKSGSKLTIEYPDGLVRIEEATNYISSKETDPNDINKSLFIIPQNGSFIFGSVKETRTVTLIYRDHQDDDPSPAEFYHNFQGIRKELDLNSHYDSDKVEYINEQCNIIQVCEFSYYFLEYNDDVMWDPGNGVNMIFDIKLEIRGIPSYFKSNVDFYYAQGESETDEHRTMYFAHKFYEPGFVGGIVVKDDDGNIIDIKTARVQDNRKDIEFNGKTTKWMNGIYLNRLKLPTVENYYNYPFTSFNYETTLQEDQVLYDGFWHSTFFDNRYQFGTFPDGIDFRGKHVDYIFDELVAISTKSVLRPGGYIYVDKDKDDNLTLKYDRLYDEQTHSWFDCDFDIIAFDNQDDEIPFFDLPRYSNICENFDETHPGHLGYLFTTRNEFAKIAKYLDFYFNKIFGLEFTGYYVEATPNPGENTYLIDPSVGIPLCDYGIVVAPVFKRKPILHVDVRCSKDADHNGAFDKLTEQHLVRIQNTLNNNKYKDLVTKRYISNGFWNSGAIEKLFLQIKLSPCKFKIVDIMAHGGKLTQKVKDEYGFNIDLPIDCTLSLMSKIHKQCLYPTLLQDLLKNRLHDEYFFITIGSCFGGGLVEDYIHNDVWQQIYTMTTPSLDMGTNYVLDICDNANSPSWGDCQEPLRHKNGDLYDFSENGESYREQANTINALVQECRTKNINLLVELLKKHYNFMRTTLLDETKLNWTQETYEKSIYNAKNLIVAYSRLDDDETKDYVIKYPILFLFHIFMNYKDFTCNDHYSDIIPLTEQTFFKRYYASISQIFYSYIQQGYYTNYVWDTPKKREQRKLPLLNEENTKFLTIDDITFLQTLTYTLNLGSTLRQFVDFFYDIYLFMHNANKNAEKIRDRNKVHFGCNLSNIGTLLDDTPTIIFSGDEEFANCKFPMCPNMPKMPSKQDLVERMPIYGVDRG